MSRTAWEASSILILSFILSLLFQIPSLSLSLLSLHPPPSWPLLWHSSFSLFSPPFSLLTAPLGQAGDHTDAHTPTHTHPCVS